MLAIDYKMLNLAKMQEALLKKSVSDRRSNLQKYKATVMNIDANAFSCILDELRQIKDHNQTLEDELQFLESIKSSYEQLLEQQLSFRKVCELYGDSSLKLADLSQLNIEYIENRINVISGYLINLKNIDINKSRLQELNEQLIEEEKKRDFFSSRLLELERILKEHYLYAEGRIVLDGCLVPTSIIDEYKKLGVDLRSLLDDSSSLEQLLELANNDRNDYEEKFKAAEICYNNAPNSENKQIFGEISKEFFNVKYRLIMLKILKLLSVSYNDYDLFKEKREQLLDLIKSRALCLKKLEIKFSIDPFDVSKILEQLSELSSLNNNFGNLSKIKKDIVQLSERLDEMISQNGVFMLEISNTKDLTIDKTSINDINFSSYLWDPNDYFSKDVVLENQVVNIRDISSQFNVEIVKQKTNLVLIRVNNMLNESSTIDNNDSERTVPKLVVVPSTVPLDSSEDISSFTALDNNNKIDLNNKNSDIFETLVPFEEISMFTDRTDDTFVNEMWENENHSKVSIPTNKKSKENVRLNFPEDISEKATSDFWSIRDESANDASSNLSFDKQVDALLSNNVSSDNNLDSDKDEFKVRKREKSIMQKAA